MSSAAKTLVIPLLVVMPDEAVVVNERAVDPKRVAGATTIDKMTSGVDMLPKSTCAMRWDSATDRFLRINGPIYMLPIRDGRVEFRRTDAPGISDGMPVEEFSRALRALLTATR